jgi:hypothetical protein
MYGRSLEIVSSPTPAERSTFFERLGRLRSRGQNVGWLVEEEFNNLWYDAVDEQQSERALLLSDEVIGFASSLARSAPGGRTDMPHPRAEVRF